MSSRYENLVGLLGMLAVAAACGCSLWQPTEVVEISELPSTRLSENTVVWEIAAVYALLDDHDFHDKVWDEADEQHLPLDVTRRLTQNGFRCGLLGSPLPTALRQRLDQQESGVAEHSGSLPVSNLPAAFQRRHLQTRARQKFQIVGPQVQDELVALFREDGELRGDRFLQAQCVFVGQSFPQGDGTAKLAVTPEIQYGPARQQFTGHGGMFQLEAKRQSKVFDQLSFQATISSGQTLVLTTTPGAIGLGSSFFTESVDGRRRQKLLLIRLAQTQYDDRFVPPPADDAPLVTSDP